MHRTRGSQFPRVPALAPDVEPAGGGGGGAPAVLSKGMTQKQVEDFIAQTVDRVLGSKIDERLNTTREVQKADTDRIIQMLQSQSSEKKADKEEKGIFAARVMLSVAGAAYSAKQGRPISPDAWAKQRWGAGNFVEKALSATVGTEGGFLIPEQVSAEIIELLRPVSVVRSLNPVPAPMDGGNLTLARIAGGSTATYIGENQNIPPSQPAWGQVRLTAKKLAALVPISNDLLRRARGNAETMVRDDVVAALAQRSDLAFLRGTGSEFSPRGLRYWALPAKVIAATAGQTLAGVTADLAKMVLTLRNSLVPLRRPGWIMTPRSQMTIATIRDTNGNFAFQNLFTMDGGIAGGGGTLFGWPYRVTTQIPDNLGGGNESEIILADFADVLLGETTGVLIDTSTEAAYWDGAQVQAAFSLDQTVIRAIVEHDLGVRHDESVAVLTGITWSPA